MGSLKRQDKQGVYSTTIPCKSEKQRVRNTEQTQLCLQNCRAQLSAARQMAAFHKLDVEPTSWKLTTAINQIVGSLCHWTTFKFVSVTERLLLHHKLHSAIHSHILSIFMQPKVNHRAGNKDPRIYISPFHVMQHITFCGCNGQPAPSDFMPPLKYHSEF